MKRFCVLNIGNTHTQFAVAQVIDAERFEWIERRNFHTSAIPFGDFPTDIFMIYSSVVPQITAVMQRKFPQSMSCVAANVPFVDFSEAPPTLGMDRIANCAALTQKSSNGIVIDSGTAITLEVIENKKFIGGAILPGTGILARAMHDYTGALPLVECSTAPSLHELNPETLTVKAMEIGIQSAAVGGTLHLLNNFLGILPEKSPIYVCGGTRSSILNQKADINIIDGGNDFTMQGLAVVAMYYINNE